MSEGGYIPAVCGHCNMPLEMHPVDQCKYEYAVVKNHAGRPIGYFMLGKKEPKKAVDGRE